jgi:hypothetical protein
MTPSDRTSTRAGCAVLAGLIVTIWYFNRTTSPSTTTGGNAVPPQAEADPESQLQIVGSIDYEVVREEVYDAPVKTQVLQHLRTLEFPSEDQPRDLLTSRAELLKQRTEFRYHSTPTSIAVRPAIPTPTNR